jgi:predicted esterase YcpF (UPF0227 family)
LPRALYAVMTRMTIPSHLLYLHGFRSSPLSAKAQQTATRLLAINRARTSAGLHPVVWVCPQLPPSPKQAIREALQALQALEPGSIALVGSSLGGFYATWLAHHLGCRAALLNTAVNPARDLRTQIGELSAWHDPSQHFVFTHEHVEELEALQVGDVSRPIPDPWRFLAVIARDDEVLDWRESAARYAGSALRLADRGGHALENYAQDHLDAVLAFLGINPAAA